MSTHQIKRVYLDNYDVDTKNYASTTFDLNDAMLNVQPNQELQCALIEAIIPANVSWLRPSNNRAVLMLNSEQGAYNTPRFLYLTENEYRAPAFGDADVETFLLPCSQLSNIGAIVDICNEMFQSMVSVEADHFTVDHDTGELLTTGTSQLLIEMKWGTPRRDADPDYTFMGNMILNGLGINTDIASNETYTSMSTIPNNNANRNRWFPVSTPKLPLICHVSFNCNSHTSYGDDSNVLAVIPVEASISGMQFNEYDVETVDGETEKLSYQYQACNIVYSPMSINKVTVPSRSLSSISIEIRDASGGLAYCPQPLYFEIEFETINGHGD